MNKKILTILLLFNFISFNIILAQEIIPDGLHQEFYENGAVFIEEYYKDGKLEGLSKSFFEDGTLMTETLYKNGKKEGISKNYYRSGVVYQEQFFANDLLDGMSKVYYESGSIRLTVNYKDGIQNGELIAYTEDSKIEYSLVYKDGRLLDKDGNLMHGIVEFTMNGILMDKVTYEDGLPVEGEDVQFLVEIY